MIATKVHSAIVSRIASRQPAPPAKADEPAGVGTVRGRPSSDIRSAINTVAKAALPTKIRPDRQPACCWFDGPPQRDETARGHDKNVADQRPLPYLWTGYAG